MKRVVFIVSLCITLLTISCEKKDNIEYPVVGYFYGINALAINKTALQTGNQYGFSAFVPEGSSLKVILKGWPGNYMIELPMVNWTKSHIDNETQSFTVTGSGLKSDLRIHFIFPCEIALEYYENGAKLPTRIKYVSVN